MNIKNDCICEDDNKLKQAVCPLHGGPAYRSHQSKSVDTKSKLVEKVTDPELVCKAAELGAQDQNDMLAQSKSVEGWKARFEKEFSVLGTDERDFDGQVVRDTVKSFIAAELSKAREGGYKKAVEEMKDIISKHNARILNEFQLQAKPGLPLVWFDERVVLIPAMDIATKKTLSSLPPKSPKEE